MPQANDLVVKNGAATPVDKTFTLYAPAAGDNSVASWKLKEGTIATVFPQFTALAKTTGNNSRQAVFKLRLPSSYTDAVTGRTQVSSAYEANITVSVPNDFPEMLKNDAVAFTVNLLSHSLVKAMIRDAVAAT